MKRYTTFFIGLFLLMTLTGCIGEDYDVGVPIAELSSDYASVPLTEANISWKTASENVQKKVDDITQFVSSLDEMKVSSGQKVSLHFKENEDNGGDIWTNTEITAALLKDNKQIELILDDSREFQFPVESGNYILDVHFTNSAGNVQYVGNILIK